jgi:two-component system cell cycle sensor histidine kinase/response regulator CckA
MNKPLRAIFVEDSLDDSALLERELRKGGWELQCHRVDSAAALQSALNEREWDLVISDHSMPGFTGLQALDLVRASTPDLPFIFVSGTIDELTAVAALREGAQDYFMKGHLQRLLPAVEREIREAGERRDRKRLEQQVSALQKFEAIGRLAGGIAHDFNNLLGAILGWAELGIEDTQAGSRAHDRFQKITEQAHRATKLTAQILAFAKRQMLQPRKLNLNTSVDDVGSLLHKLIGDRVEIRVQLESYLRVTMADPAQIEQILMNLCLNARDAMPDGGVMVIETRNVEIAEVHLRIHPEAQPGNYVMLSVSDTGVGMDKGTVERIFEPFFTTKELGRGTGLGLATVYGIVKQHGGFIYVYSEPGKGTAFRLYFPSCDGSPDAPELKVPVELRRGTETILLADDHDGLRQTAQEMLRELGYQVLTATNGREAVDLFSAHLGRVDLVLLDVMMPEMDGPEAYEQIKNLRPNVPVVFTSGYTPDAVPFIAAVGKSSLVLQKPYAMKSLSQMIRTALDDATARRAVPTTTTDDAAESVSSAAPASTSIPPPLIISKDN